MSTDRIEKRIELKAPVARVWRALADHRQFGAWFRAELEEPFAPGKVVRGRITYPGYEHVKMAMQVVEMVPERLFSFRWHPNAVDANVDYSKEPQTLVEFRLEPSPGGTLLRLTESGFDQLPAGPGRDEAFRRNEGGWTEQMKNIERHVLQAP